MMDSFTKPEPRVATRVRAFKFSAQVSDDDIPAVEAVEAVAGVEAVKAVEAVEEVVDEEGNVIVEAVEAVEGVEAVEEVKAVKAVPAHTDETYNYFMNYDVLDQDGKVMQLVAGEFSAHLTPTERTQLQKILDKGYKLAKDSIL